MDERRERQVSTDFGIISAGMSLVQNSRPIFTYGDANPRSYNPYICVTCSMQQARSAMRLKSALYAVIFSCMTLTLPFPG